MIKNYFLTAIRNILKQKGYFFLNTIGLAIGLTSFILITIYVIHELSYDKFNTKIDRIYRVKVSGQMSGQELDQAITAPPMAKVLIDEFPEIENVVRIAEFGAWRIYYNDKKFNEDGVIFADSTFFDVFDYKLLRGNPSQALAEPRSIILTEDFAKKYFGDEDPIGKRMNVESDTIFYKVTGVIENAPETSHFHFDMLASMNSLTQPSRNNWFNHQYYTYIVLNKEADPMQLEAKFPLIIEKYAGPQLKQLLGITMEDFQKAGNTFSYHLQALKDIHLHSKLQEELEPNGDVSYVYIFSIIAFLILVIAIINFVNLSTAKAATRAKEVGVRKVVGSSKRSLVFQFIGESVIISIISTIIAMVVVEIFMPSFGNLIGKNFSVHLFSNSYGIILTLLLGILVGILAGIYPAFFMAAFSPISVLKGSVSKGAKSGWLRSVLVVMQFVVSIIIIIGTFIIYKQLSYMQNKNLGFNSEQLLVVRRPDVMHNHLEAYKLELLKNHNILGVANSRAIPGKEYSNNAMFRDDDPDKSTYLIYQNWVSLEYPELMGYKLVEGRFFSKEFPSDSNAVIVNETTMKLFGYESCVGRFVLQPRGGNEFQKYPIIGVVKDFNFMSLHHKIEPVCLNVMPGNWEGYLNIRVNTEDINQTIAYVGDKWSEFSGGQPFQYFFFDSDFNNLYQAEKKTGHLFIAFGFLAIIIACLGLLGLIAFTAVVRTKEIGVRKTFGAGVPTIIGLLSQEVLKLIIIASVIAWPIAYFATNYWLQDFADRISIGIMIFILATLLTLFIAWITISFQAIRAALANPVDALRYE